VPTSGSEPQPSAVRQNQRLPVLRACLKMGRGSAAGEFWVGQGGERRGRPPAVCSARTNEVQAGKTRRRTPPHFQTGSQRVRTGGVVALVGNGAWALRAFRGNGRRVLPKGTVEGTGAGTTALRAGAPLLVPTNRDDNHER